jgi:hypothetical protein
MLLPLLSGLCDAAFGGVGADLGCAAGCGAGADGATDGAGERDSGTCCGAGATGCGIVRIAGAALGCGVIDGGRGVPCDWRVIVRLPPCICGDGEGCAPGTGCTVVGDTGRPRGSLAGACGCPDGEPCSAGDSERDSGCCALEGAAEGTARCGIAFDGALDGCAPGVAIDAGRCGMAVLGGVADGDGRNAGAPGAALPCGTLPDGAFVAERGWRPIIAPDAGAGVAPMLDGTCAGRDIVAAGANVDAAAGTLSPGRRVGTRPASARSIGAPESIGAVATTLVGTRTMFCWTGRCVTSDGPEMAVTPPGAFQFT